MCKGLENWAPKQLRKRYRSFAKMSRAQGDSRKNQSQIQEEGRKGLNPHRPAVSFTLVPE